MSRATLAEVVVYGTILIIGALIPYVWPVQAGDPLDLPKRLAFVAAGGVVIFVAYRVIGGRSGH